MKKLTILVFLCLSSTVFGSNIAVEKPLLAYIKQEQTNQLRLLEKLVNINSGTMNIAGIKTVGEYLKKPFAELGFDVQWSIVPNGIHRAPTLIAKHPGSSHAKILLIGHLDTVFAKNSPFQRFKQNGSLAVGPGVVDDKGGDVVILYALKALQHLGALSNADITVVLTGDEEDSGKPTALSRKALIDAAKDRNIALDFELASTKDTAVIGRRGFSRWEIATHGTEAHSSMIFNASANLGAIYELARILNAIRMTFIHEKNVSLSPGLILGGTSLQYDVEQSAGHAFGEDNVIAQTAMAAGDLRFLSTSQKNQTEQRLVAIVAEHLLGTEATIHFQDGIPAMPPTSENLNLLNRYSQSSQALGFGPMHAFDPGLRGAGDISYVAPFVKACLAGLGPEGEFSHSEKETLNIDSLSRQTARAAMLLYQLTRNTEKTS